MKRIISMTFIVAMILSLNIGVYAENIPTKEELGLMTNEEGFITDDWSKVNYISVSEYIKKYGGENNVNRAFNQAELKNDAMLLKAEGKLEQANALLNQKVDVANKPSDLLASLKEGKFLGLEIEGITDLPPTNINLSVRVKGNMTSRVPNVDSTELITNNSNKNMANAKLTKNGYHSDGSAYKILYTDSYPSSSDINTDLYEPESGSYFYKYGYSWKGDYRCTAELKFDNNSKLYTGTQDVNMYIFVGAAADAASGGAAIDFGFIANPKDNSRNKGLYAVRNIGRGGMDVETFPKVNIVGSTTNPMTLESKTIKLQLTIGDNGVVGTEMFLNGNLIYHKSEFISGFASGNDKVLTFYEAMSCVDSKCVYTNPKSGSYLKNIKFNNTKLYNINDGEREFGTYGNDTYCVYICKPENISYSYGTNSETVSIEYK